MTDFCVHLQHFNRKAIDLVSTAMFFKVFYIFYIFFICEKKFQKPFPLYLCYSVITYVLQPLAPQHPLTYANI